MGSISAAALPEEASLRLRLLGRFELTGDGGPLRVRPSGERLLAYLAVRSEPVLRHEAATALWPDSSDVRAAANLRSVLWRLPGPEDGLVRCQARGIVLPDWPEHWVITTREWFRQVRLHALEKLCDQHLAAGRLDSALATGLTTVACDPLRESAHLRLALVHIREGNFAEALRQYHVYQRLARSELGLPPSPQFRQLMSPLLGRPADL